MTNETLTTIFIIATAVAVSLQALILLALFITVRKSIKAIQTEVEQLRTAATPILNHTKDFVSRLTPKLDSVAGDLVEVSRNLRTQTVEFHASATEILERVHRHTGRMDEMFTHTLDKVDRAGNAVNDAVNVPLKQLSGITAFAKAALAVLRSDSPKPRTQPAHAAADKDLFV